MLGNVHVPVLARELKELFSNRVIKNFVDCTLGAGGHACLLLKECFDSSVNYYGFDQDGEILNIADERLCDFKKQVKLIHQNFSLMDEELDQIGVSKVDGILMDLGVSSYQLDTPKRGFSHRFDEPLDMRMDLRQGLTAYDVLNGYSENELYRVFKELGEIKRPRIWVKKIIDYRHKKSIQTTFEFLNLIKGYRHRKGVNEKSLFFQALRMEVNQELKKLEKALPKAFERLNDKGVLAVISFHSLEDRMVKKFFNEQKKTCVCPPELPVCQCTGKAKGRLVYKKIVEASKDEMRENPRSRSAKLRALEKICA